jgi:hypothetical protein
MGGFFSGTNQGKSNIRIIDDNGEEVFGINTIHFSNGNIVKDTSGKVRITSKGEKVNLFSSTDEKIDLNSFNYFTPIADDAQSENNYEISGDATLNATAITLVVGERFTLVGGVSHESVAKSVYSTAQYNSNIGVKEFEGEGNLQTNPIYFTTNLNFTGVDSSSISASIGQNLFDSINIEAINENTLRIGGQLSTVKCIWAGKFSIGEQTVDIILIESATAGRSGPTCFTLSMVSGGD